MKWEKTYKVMDRIHKMADISYKGEATKWDKPPKVMDKSIEEGNP